MLFNIFKDILFGICCEEIVFVKDVEIVLEFWDWIEMICCDGNSRDGGGIGNLEVIFFLWWIFIMIFLCWLFIVLGFGLSIILVFEFFDLILIMFFGLVW